MRLILGDAKYFFVAINTFIFELITIATISNFRYRTPVNHSLQCSQRYGWSASKIISNLESDDF
jgi:hypothetical protein